MKPWKSPQILIEVRELYQDLRLIFFNQVLTSQLKILCCLVTLTDKTKFAQSICQKIVIAS